MIIVADPSDCSRSMTGCRAIWDPETKTSSKGQNLFLILVLHEEREGGDNHDDVEDGCPSLKIWDLKSRNGSETTETRKVRLN